MHLYSKGNSRTRKAKKHAQSVTLAITRNTPQRILVTSVHQASTMLVQALLVATIAGMVSTKLRPDGEHVICVTTGRLWLFWEAIKKQTVNSVILAVQADTNAPPDRVIATVPHARGAFALTESIASYALRGSFLGSRGLVSVRPVLVGSSAHLKDRRRVSHACLVTSLARHRLYAQPAPQACFKPRLDRTGVM